MGGHCVCVCVLVAIFYTYVCLFVSQQLATYCSPEERTSSLLCGK